MKTFPIRRIYGATVMGPRIGFLALAGSSLTLGLTGGLEPGSRGIDAVAWWGCLGVVLGAIYGYLGPLRRTREHAVSGLALRFATWCLVAWLLARLWPYAIHEPLRFGGLAAFFLLGGFLTAEITIPKGIGHRRRNRERPDRSGLFPLVGPSVFVACAATTVGCPSQFVVVDSAPAPRTRVALIGLDGADRALMDQASRMGRTPNVDRLRRTGAWGELSPEIAFSPPSWTTIATGLPAADHGVDGFMQRRYSNGRIGPENPRDLGHRTDRATRRFLDRISRSPDWVAAPGTWITRNLALPVIEQMAPDLGESFEWVPTDASGVQRARIWEIAASHGRNACVVRWLFTDPSPRIHGLQVLSGWKDGWRTPVGASSPDLLELARSISTEVTDPADEASLDHYLETAAQEVHQGRTLAGKLAPGSDLYAHVFYFPDGLGHRLAQSMANAESDSAHTRGTDRFLELMGDVDRLVGDLTDEGFSIVIVSDHGMEPVPEDLSVPIVSQVLGIDWSALLDATNLRGSRGDWFRPSEGSDLRLETTALAPPGALQRAATVLAGLKTSDGDRLFGSVTARENTLEFSGPLRVAVADLNKHKMKSPTLGTLDRFVHHRGIEGIHGRPLPGLDRDMGHDGILIAKGPGLSGGRYVAGLQNRDVAPLVLHWLDLPLEPGHSTQGIDALFDPAYLAVHRPVQRTAPSDTPRYASGNEPDHGEALREIRALGYLN